MVMAEEEERRLAEFFQDLNVEEHQSVEVEDGIAREFRHQQMREMLDLLVHAPRCHQTTLCPYPNCGRAKGLFRHGAQCKRRSEGGCRLCWTLSNLLKLHAEECQEFQCIVPRCRELKEHLRRMQLQVQVQVQVQVQEEQGRMQQQLQQQQQLSQQVLLVQQQMLQLLPEQRGRMIQQQLLEQQRILQREDIRRRQQQQQVLQREHLRRHQQQLQEQRGRMQQLLQGNRGRQEEQQRMPQLLEQQRMLQREDIRRQ